MDIERIAAIRARLAAAAPGPWREEDPALLFSHRFGGRYIVGGVEDYHPTDVALIANAPADLADLCDEVERLKAEREELRAAIYRHMHATPYPGTAADTLLWAHLTNPAAALKC